MATKEGQVKKTSLEAYSRPRKNGIKAINIREGDSLLEASLTDGDSTVLLANRSGRAIRFHENGVRERGRNTSGVRGMSSEKGDELVGRVVNKNTHEYTVGGINDSGYGQRAMVIDDREHI